MANAYAPTFSELVDEVQDICENTNDEFVDNIPKFIHRAQDQIQKDLGLSLWRDYFDLSISTAEIARDTDWLIVKSIWLPDEEKFLEQRTVDYVRRCGGTGRPKYWAEDMENTIIVAPTPDAPYDATVEFYARLAALSEANETNWITRNAGDLLLVQTLLNAGIYLVANERVNECTGIYSALMPQLQNELRASERLRYQPIRAATRPAIQPGGFA